MEQEHPNNQRNRDNARGCHATYFFLDGKSFKESFLPVSDCSYEYLLHKEGPMEIFWMHGSHSVISQNQEYFRFEGAIYPKHMLEKVQWVEFIPEWDGDFPKIPE